MSPGTRNESMRVCEVSEFGGAEVLRGAERPWPRPGPGEVVVTIAAANINPSDIAARSGAHRARMPDLQPPFVPGWDLAGVVSEVGAEASGYAVGSGAVGGFAVQLASQAGMRVLARRRAGRCAARRCPDRRRGHGAGPSRWCGGVHAAGR